MTTPRRRLGLVHRTPSIYNFLQDNILWWRKVLANIQSIQAILCDQCIGKILEENVANHSTIAFPPMCTKLDKVAAQISFSRIHHAVEGDMIFCHPIGNQVFWDRTTSKCCKKDILRLCQLLELPSVYRTLGLHQADVLQN